MSVKVESKIKGNLRNIYEQYKQELIKSGAINNKFPERQLENIFLRLLKDPKNSGNILNTINKPLNIREHNTVNLKIEFLKKHGVEVELKDKSKMKLVNKFLDKKIQKIKNKIYLENQEKNKKLQEELNKCLEELNEPTPENSESKE